MSARLPGPVIVFGRFHVMKLFNEKLFDLCRKATDVMQKKGPQGDTVAAAEGGGGL